MKPTFPVLKLVLMAVVMGASIQMSPAVVGYYNVAMPPGWSLVANPLIHTISFSSSNANDVFTLGPPPDGTLLYRFDPTIQDYKSAGTYLTGVGWYPLSGNTNDADLNLPLGEGFFVWSPRSWTNTFVGEVAQGNLTNPIPAYYSLKASMVPQGGSLHSTLVFPNVTSDFIYRLSNTNWVTPPFTASVYDFDADAWLPPPNIGVAQGFFVRRDPGEATVANWWVRNFVVQRLSGETGGNSSPKILGIDIHDGMVTLQIGKITEQYNVQFSTDRENWITIAVNQTATVWKGPLPPGPQGFFQITQP